MTYRQSLPLPALLACALALAAPAHGQQRVDERAATGPAPRVEVHARGAVHVTGWGRSEVHVSGTLGAPGDRVVLDATRGSVEVRVVGSRGRGAPAALEIRVPAGSSVDVAGGNGPIRVTGVRGEVEATSEGGPLTVEGAPRRIEVASTGGPVTISATTGSVEVSSMGGTVRIAGTVRERAEVNALGGNVEVTATVGQLEVNSVGGNVRATATEGRVEITAVAGDVLVRGSRLRGSVQTVSGNVLATAASLAGPLSLESHSGNVELRIPEGVGATVRASTFSGRFTSEVGGGGGGGRERTVVVGGGGPTVSLTTFSGTLKLARP